MSAWLVIAIACVIAPRDARAQEQAPLRLTLVNVAGADGDRAYETITSVLRETPSIEFIDGETLRAQMDKFAINDKILKQGRLREKFRNRIGRMMLAGQIEGMLVLDVYSRGRKLQLVAVGPDGGELRDVKRTVRGGRIERDDAIESLNRLFPSLAPAVLTYRERQARLEASTSPPPPPAETPAPAPAQQESAGVAARLNEGSPQTGDAQVGAIEPTPAAPPLDGFSQSISVGAGLLVGSRQMLVRETAVGQTDSIRHGTQFLGIAASIDAIALVLNDQRTSALALEGFGGYAPFKTGFRTPGEQTTEYDSSLSYFGAQAVYRRLLNPQFILSLYGGAQLFNLTIDPNPNYGGNRYATGRLGIQTEYILPWIGASARVHGGLLPVFSADNSGGALGESPLSLGYEAGGRLAVHLTDSLSFSVLYTFQYYQPDFPTPSENSRIDTEASSSDAVHAASVQIGLAL